MSRTATPDSALLPLSTFQTFLEEIDAFDAPSCNRLRKQSAAQARDAPALRRKKRASPIKTTSAPLAPTNTKKGHSQRTKMLIRQIHVLRQQLKRLHDDHQREVVSAQPTGTNWKRQAILETCLKTQSMDENKQLKKRLADGAMLVQTMRSLVLKQILAIRQIQATTKPPSPSGFILLDEDTRTFASIKASMDARLFNLDSSMHKRLRVLTTQCIAGAVPTSSQWSVSNSGEGVLMSMEMSALIPFEIELINTAICRHVQVNTTNKLIDKASRRALTMNDADFSLVESGRVDVDSRTIFRRVRNEYGFVVMWESVSTWQSAENAADGNPKRAIVRDHGWSIFAPAAGYAKDVSISHCQIACKIQSTDEMPLQQEDQFANSIVRHNQQTIASQSQLMENKLMDRSLCVSVGQQ